MNIAYYIVGVIAALWIGFSSYSLFTRKAFVADALKHYGLRARDPGNPETCARTLDV